MSLVQVENDGGVAVVTLNRPEKHNALNAEMMVRLAETWDQIAQDESVRVVLLTGAGDRAFWGSLAPLATGAKAPETAYEQRLVYEHLSLVDRVLSQRFRCVARPLHDYSGGTCASPSMRSR
jgi:1,4-dihydroxy-2-naphthoyl-CoA synthase